MKFCVILWCLLFGLMMNLSATSLTDKQKRNLLELASKWEIPQPVKRAQLVKFWAFERGGKSMYLLGFYEGANKERVLIGFDSEGTSGRKLSELQTIEVDPMKLTSLEDVTGSTPFGGLFEYNSGLVTGIQLVRNGNIGLGWTLFEKSLSEDAGQWRSAFYIKANEAPALMLAKSCLASYLSELGSKKPNYVSIEQRIIQLVNDQPELDTKALVSVLVTLKLTSRYALAPKGTQQFLVDQYMMGGVTHSALSVTGMDSSRLLSEKGFEVIPELLRQSQSKRFTNHVMEGFNNFLSFPMTAEQVIDQYLNDFSGGSIGGGWLSRQKGYTSKEAARNKWWEEAQKLGEKDYVRKNLLKRSKKGKRELEINTYLLVLAEVKYPTLLPEAYERIVATSGQSWELAKAVGRAKGISQRKKENLYAMAVKAGNNHRNVALLELRKLNFVAADELLVRIMNKAPRTTKSKYWTDSNAYLGQLAMCSNDPKVWASLVNYLKKADLGMSMELINKMRCDISESPQAADFLLMVFDRYKNSKVVRNEKSSSKFEGPCAGFPFVKITLRDFIHQKWAKLLKLEIERPNKNWVEQDWMKFRVKVAKEVEMFRLGVR